MPGTIDANGPPATDDPSVRLAVMADRTSLMAIDEVLRALPGEGIKARLGLTDAAGAAAEVAALARRMRQATRDFGAAMQELAPAAAPRVAMEPAE